MKPTTLKEAPFGGGGVVVSSPVGADEGVTSVELEGGGEGGEEEAGDGGGDNEETGEGEGGELVWFLRSAKTTTTNDSFFMQLASFPLMK
ncbi:hypothetical protein COCNU_contig69562029G000010 [Cocos nucifera]|nr:hypothetical protein [Cocos nucifera]